MGQLGGYEVMLGRSKEIYNPEEDFEYLSEETMYLDAACQSLRPAPVIRALDDYYEKFNSCGERVKYDWGREVDKRVAETREKVLKWLRLSEKKFFVSFTLNTTYGINLLLNQFKSGLFRKVVTSDIEHNSPFLATVVFAKKHGIPREVIKRESDGSIDLSKVDFTGALVVVNVVSNIDGRRLENVVEVVDAVHAQGGVVVLDAAQAMAHNWELLEEVEADAVCFSGHKMYAPSLGILVVSKPLMEKVDVAFIGGGMVSDVEKDSYQLLSNDEDHIHTAFEPGLQGYGEIIALSVAIDWLKKNKKKSQLPEMCRAVFDGLRSKADTVVLNEEARPVISFFHNKLDSHLLARALSEESIMVRSGYLCCHYYLDHEMHYPPVVRISMGMHNTMADVEKLLAVFARALV